MSARVMDPKQMFGGHEGSGFRARRGGLAPTILRLLSEKPMHGYEIITTLAAKTSGMWRPSAGAVYPTLQLLVDEGLIAGTESEGSKRLFELTDDGRAAADKVETPPWQEMHGAMVRRGSPTRTKAVSGSS